MSKIRILPEILSNKIAAGEVVERPAAVVKELVENALDAGATRIMVEVQSGGRALIRVSDNGCGMGHDDALLAIERYATSKIYEDRDLYSIRTLGFRGEALPSIAAVSRFALVSREASADAGIEIFIDGGKIKKVSETGAPPGTMVTVKQLFFNTPARRKFLKTVGTEMGHIADMVAGISLGHPQIGFRLIHNAKTVKNWPATDAAVQRVMDVLGADLKGNLHRIEFENNGIAVSGWISAPRIVRKTSRGLFIYVNGRLVRDRIIGHALFKGYSQRLVKGRFPVAVVFIKVPFDEVDVNVHPTKNEVRFARQREVHEAVRRTVAQTLYEVDRPQWRPAGSPVDAAAIVPNRVSEAGPQEFGRRKTEGGDWKSECGMRNVENESWKPEQAAGHSAARFAQAPIWQHKRFADLRVIGQLHNTYIVCEADDGLILIDQHAAHERILFERFQTRAAGPRPAAQRLLVPETVELGYREAGVLEKMLPELEKFGLEIEPFGGNSFVVKSVPALLADREVTPLVIEIVEKIVQIGSGSGLAQVIDECRMVMACHGAIRANQALSGQQIKKLLTQLDACDNPSHCPHGRPTWILWKLRSLEKSFQRIV
jgi:DNA mismatch repair protein MutL